MKRTIRDQAIRCVSEIVCDPHGFDFGEVADDILRVVLRGLPKPIKDEFVYMCGYNQAIRDVRRAIKAKGVKR